MIKWIPAKHAIGIEKIDDQHQHLHQLVSDLYSSFIKNEHKEKLLSYFDALLAYTKNHFKYEEELFEKFDYPKKYSHTEEHNEFVRTIENFRTDYTKGNKNLTFQLINYLNEWLEKHTFSSDRAYVNFMKSKGIS